MPIKDSTAKRIHFWTDTRGGFGGRPKAHALRLLREVVELCIAARADVDDINKAVNDELMKAISRGEFLQVNEPVNPAELKMEVADSTNLLEVFCHHYNIDQDEACRIKLQVLEQRDWLADQDGVLWRR